MEVCRFTTNANASHSILTKALCNNSSLEIQNPEGEINRMLLAVLTLALIGPELAHLLKHH
jgi:hypothetical protein